jgi:hypothetical protein
LDSETIIDPGVAKAKFARQITQWRAHEKEQWRRGIWLVEDTFPRVFAVFAAPQLKPKTVLFGAELDFTNYDFWPPAVRLVDPFTREPYTGAHPPILVRRNPATPQVPAELVLQAHNPNDIPFLCLPGVREYHSHPAHTGDHWLLHRNTGEGTLWFLLDKLHEFGVMPLKSLQFQILVQHAGFELG